MSAKIKRLYLEEDPRQPDRYYMERAIQLAKLCKSEAGKISPKVGAVIVRDSQLVGEAYRGELGEGEHAEYTLLERKLARVSLEGAKLYTTLEPCTTRHDPKVPCAHRIIERGIDKVFIGVIDPNELVRGDGWWTLREADIEVATFDPDLVQQIDDLNLDFTLHYRALERRNAAGIRRALTRGQIGPNGGRIGYLENGDKVEWIPSKSEPGKERMNLLRRNDKAVFEEWAELWDKTFWHRHQTWRRKIETGELKVTKKDIRMLKEMEDVLNEMQDMYGRASFDLTEHEWTLVAGRFSALSWVMGMDWDESLDT
jgi:pyrimidine deaminase RibD-like protein